MTNRDYEREDVITALWTLAKAQLLDYTQVKVFLGAFDERREQLEQLQEELDLTDFGHPRQVGEALDQALGVLASVQQAKAGAGGNQE